MPLTSESTNQKGNGERFPRAAEVRERVGEVRERADDLARTVGSLARDLEDAVTRETKRRPYQAVAAAATVGFVLGGGLSMGVLRLAMRVGARLATAALLERALQGSSGERK
jgi:ElaB/YqjD/DUF883 family membrane-anchored ribosome-binding protein